MANLYIMMIVLALFWLQLLLGGLALHIPLCVGGIFYVSVAYSWRRGIFWAILAGVSLDLFYCRGIFLSTWAFIGVVVFAEYWLRKNDMRHLRNSILPGALIALISVCPVWIYKLLVYSSDVVTVFKDMLPITIFTFCLNAFMLPLMVLFFDEIAEKVKLPLFTAANKRLLD